jgi:ribosomal-protein-alanine N-acetyltransferase
MAADPKTLHVMVRNLTEEDLDRLIEIEHAAYPFPWTRGIFADCIRVGYDCTGLQVGPALIGYTIQSLAAGENHLLNLCIEPGWQGNGYGNLMLDHAIRLAGEKNCSCMFLEVRPSNPAGMGLYERKGFSIVGQRPGYYRSADGREDAMVMRLDL